MEGLSTGTQLQFLVGMKTPGMISLRCWGELEDLNQQLPTGASSLLKRREKDKGGKE